MASSKEEDPIAPAAFTEIETAGSFKVREGFGSNLETKYQSEWAMYIGCWVNGGDMVEELQSRKPGENGLVEHNFNINDLITPREFPCSAQPHCDVVKWFQLLEIPVQTITNRLF